MKIIFLFLIIFSAQHVTFTQCNNCPPGSTYNNNFDALTTNLSGAHTCLAINAIYTVNDDVDITTSSIFLGPNAEIRVQSGVTLTLNDCTISGCDEMWWRILVQPGGILIAEDVDFYDGINAVDARGNAELTVRNCYFTNNHIGLHIRNRGQGPGVVFTEPLSNNIFETNGDLLPPHAGEIGFAGIRVRGAAPVTVGQVGLPQNQFINLSHGIFSENSMVTIENALFQAPNIIDLNGMIGISCDESEIQVSNSTFNNCSRGINSMASDLIVETNNFFASNFRGIEITNSLNRTVRVDGNFFTDIKSQGITVNNNGGSFEEFIIENNEIEIDFSPFPAAPGIVAVRLMEPVSINQTRASISNNQIELFSTAFGIAVQFNDQVDINENNIDITMFENVGLMETHGILLRDCDEINVIRDTVIGLRGLDIGTIHAIETENTSNANICSNFLDNTSVGFKFDGANPDMLLRHNSLNNHDRGLYISIDEGDGFIGDQGMGNQAHDNRWETNGTFNLDAARNDNALFFISESEFHVRNAQQPQLPPSISTPNVPGANWFDLFGTGATSLCEPNTVDPPNTFNGMELSIANGTTPFSMYPEAQYFRSETNFHRKLRNNPGLLGLNVTVDSFYTAMENGAIGTFYQVTEGISQLGQPDAATEQQYNNLEHKIENNMSQLIDVDTQLVTATGSYRDSIIVKRIGLVLEIDSLFNEKQQLDSTILVQRISAADQLIALNAGAITTSAPQQYQQTVNAIYLNTIAKANLSFSQTEIDQLTLIANSCLYEFGPAVSGARNLLSIVNDSLAYDDELLCSPPSESNSMIGLENSYATNEQLTISPNPASRNANIYFPVAEENAELAIFDQAGVLKFRRRLSPNTNRYDLQLDKLSPGLSLVRLNTDGRILTGKLVVIE